MPAWPWASLLLLALGRWEIAFRASSSGFSRVGRESVPSASHPASLLVRERRTAGLAAWRVAFLHPSPSRELSRSQPQGVTAPGLPPQSTLRTLIFHSRWVSCALRNKPPLKSASLSSCQGGLSGRNTLGAVFSRQGGVFLAWRPGLQPARRGMGEGRELCPLLSILQPGFGHREAGGGVWSCLLGIQGGGEPRLRDSPPLTILRTFAGGSGLQPTGRGLVPRGHRIGDHTLVPEELR